MSGTIRKHHPKGAEAGLLAKREAQAKLEWEQQGLLIQTIKAGLRSLPSEARKEIFSEFCTSCGGDSPRCRCWDDE